MRKTTLTCFAGRFPGEILDATSQEIDAWLRSLEVAPGTRNSMLRCIKVFFSFARSRNYLPEERNTAADLVRLIKNLSNDHSINFKHYRELTTEDEADKWFGILPKGGQWENTFVGDKQTGRATLNGKVIKWPPVQSARQRSLTDAEWFGGCWPYRHHHFCAAVTVGHDEADGHRHEIMTRKNALDSQFPLDFRASGFPAVGRRESLWR